MRHNATRFGADETPDVTTLTGPFSPAKGACAVKISWFDSMLSAVAGNNLCHGCAASVDRRGNAKRRRNTKPHRLVRHRTRCSRHHPAYFAAETLSVRGRFVWDQGAERIEKRQL